MTLNCIDSIFLNKKNFFSDYWLSPKKKLFEKAKGLANLGK